jgi:hypothetical protein
MYVAPVCPIQSTCILNFITLYPLFYVLCFCNIHCNISSRDSSVGIATRYGLGRSGDRIPVGARFSATVQTGSETHPASDTVGTGSFPGLKRPERGAEHPSHLAPRLKKEQSYISTPVLGSWPVLG